MKLRSHLVILVIASLLPVILFAVVMVYLSYRDQQADVERGMIDTARALSLAVDRELEVTIRTLQALATSEHLSSGDLRKFYRVAQDVLKSSGGWESIGLIDPLGRQVLNSRRPFGTKLPRAAEPETIKQVVETRKPAISNLLPGTITGTPLVVIRVPVIRRGQVRYVLASSTSPTFLANLLKEQKLSPDWLATIIDRNKIIIARTRDLEKFLGKPTTATFAARTKEAKEATWRGTTLDGVEVVAAASRSDLSGWAVGLAVPVATVEASMRRSVLLISLGGILLLLVGASLAATVAYRIARAARRLSAGGQALGKGDTPRVQPSPIFELDQVAREIETAAVNRRRIELALQQSEARYKTIIEAEPECVKIVASDGRVVEMNPAGLAMLEAASLEEVKAHPLLDFIMPEYRLAFGDLHKRVMEGESGTLEFEVIGLKETRRWLDTHATPLRDEDGKPIALLGITRDITFQKHAEREIQRNLERIEALRAIGQAITSSLDLRSVLHVLLEKIELFLPIAAALTVRLLNRENERFEFLACRGMDESQWNADRVGARSRKIVATKAPLAVFNVNTDPLTYNHEIFRKHGLISYLGVPLIAKGEVLGVLGIYTKEAHDFSKEEIEFFTTLAGQAAIAIQNAQLHEQTKKQAETLEQSNRVKDEFLSVMSHELRTPLSVVTGYAGLIKDRMLGEINPQQEAALQKVLGRAGEQLNMINDLMQTTQLEARAVAVERQPVDVPYLLDQLKSDYDLRLYKTDVSLVWDYPSGPMPITTDGAKLKQMLQNLINNAIKFTDKGNVKIAVGVRGHDSRFIEFKVQDTGVGIPKDQQTAVFEKFYQVDSSETRLYGGVGLGLFIVKKFTELLGGQIDVESEVGKGTTFTVTLPV